MQQDSSQKTVIIATLAFIIGFGLAWLIATSKTPAGQSADSLTASTTENIAAGDVSAASSAGNSIQVANQSEGVQVSVQSVSMTQSGWVVIHEDEGGKPGHILGAQLFDAGTATNATVDLLRGTQAGNVYYAMLHTDNGDRAFDPKTDLPVLDSDGNAVMASFTASAANAQ